MKLGINKKRLLSFVMLVFCGMFAFNLFFAQATSNTLPTLKNASDRLTTFGVKGGFSATANIDTVIGSVIQYALSFLGVIFLVLFVYGGFLWMQARGDSDAVSKAKETMINASIGLGIVLGAYIISYYIVSSLTGATLS